MLEEGLNSLKHVRSGLIGIGRREDGVVRGRCGFRSGGRSRRDRGRSDRRLSAKLPTLIASRRGRREIIKRVLLLHGERASRSIDGEISFAGRWAESRNGRRYTGICLDESSERLAGVERL